MTIKNIDELESMIKNSPAVLVYFSSPACSVCGVLKPKMFEEVARRYPDMKCAEVDISIAPEAGASLNVLAAPTAVIFLDGREFARKTRAFSPSQLLDEVQRAYDILFS